MTLKCVFSCPSPQRVEHFPIVPDPEQLVGRRDPVGVGILGIPKDGVGQPDQANHIAGGRQRERERDKERERERRKEGEKRFLLSSFTFL